MIETVQAEEDQVDGIERRQKEKNRTLGQTVKADAAPVAASESHRIWKSPGGQWPMAGEGTIP